MSNKIKHFVFAQAGQGMTEYIIIVALIAVAAIGAASFFGQTVRQQVAAMAGEVAGNAGTSNTARTAADTAATNSSNAAAVAKGLHNYDASNNQQ
jgi:Flp pilus assembly pilin Flp